MNKEIEIVWEPHRKLYESYIGMDIEKMAIVSGRKLYANEWGFKENGKPILCNIDPAYENVDTFT